MRAFTVTVRTDEATVCYTALAHSSADAICDAIDEFGVCAVTATTSEASK
jgi:hypothetical protein